MTFAHLCLYGYSQIEPVVRAIYIINIRLGSHFKPSVAYFDVVLMYTAQNTIVS